MSHDLNLYNTQTLQELYAVSYWKAYKVWPRYSHSIPKSKAELIAEINYLSTKGESHANGN